MAGLDDTLLLAAGGTTLSPTAAAVPASALWRLLQRSPLSFTAALLLVIVVLAAAFAPWIAPHDPFDLATIDIMASKLPPRWLPMGDAAYLLGTDNQGRDIFSLILFGLRSSLLVGFLSIVAAMAVGVPLGLLAGYFGGLLDSFLMRVADVQLSFPAILIALLVGGIAQGMVPPDERDHAMLVVLIFAIALSQWVLFARMMRGITQSEKAKDYVLAARVMRLGSLHILARHILPNAVGPLTVLATINVATSIMLEATLSFLGVGLPPTSPSLGTLIRIGNDYLFSGMWWMAAFPGLVLVILSVSVNVLGDWLRDVLNPKALR